MKSNNLFLKIFILTYLSLLFNGELYAHGLYALINMPLLIFYLIFMLFILILKERFKLNPPTVFITGSIIGLLLETFYTKSIFVSPFFLGVNWLSVFIQIIYWGMAAFLPFYFYNMVFNGMYRENKWANSVIVIYLLTEFILGSFIKYPNTIWIWIFTGLIMGVFVIKIITHPIKELLPNQ